jgi:hypothetical protein
VHRPLGQQFEDRGADVAALTASSPAAATAARTARAAEAEADTAARIESELEATARTKAGACVVLAQMVTKLIAKLAAGLPPLLMKSPSIAWPEADAESAGRWGEWVGHVW